MIFLFFYIATRDDVINFYHQLDKAIWASLTSPLVYSGNTRGGIPHFELGVAVFPYNLRLSPPSDSFPVDVAASIPVVSVRFDMGLWGGRGFTPGVGGYGSIDLFFGACAPVIQKVSLPGHFIRSRVPGFFGGVRIGFLRDSPICPGISISYQYARHRLEFDFDFGTGRHTGTYTAVTHSVYMALTKKFVFLAPYLSGGFDLLSSSGYYDGGTPRRFTAAGRGVIGVRIHAGFFKIHIEGGTAGRNRFVSVSGRLAI